jgi:hypothetical protein
MVGLLQVLIRTWQCDTSLCQTLSAGASQYRGASTIATAERLCRPGS